MTVYNNHNEMKQLLTPPTPPLTPCTPPSPSDNKGCHVRSICSGSYSFNDQDGRVILDQRPSELYVPSLGDDDDDDDYNDPSSFLQIDANNIYKQSPTPEETDSLINESLTRFNIILDTIDVDEKYGYLMAKEKCPDLCSDTFKLIFLRCEVFNVEKSVLRFVKYWNTRLEVFGNELAFLPMTLDGAMQNDVDAVSLKYLQLAKDTTDPYGRAILLFDFNVEGDNNISSESLLRVVWYQVHQALIKESVQKQGVVVYVRCLDNMAHWRPSLSKQIVQAGRGILPVRFAGMHFMNPPTFLSIIMRFVKPLVGKELRHRFYTHSGSVDNVLETLDKFGLGSSDLLPIEFGGNLEFV